MVAKNTITHDMMQVIIRTFSPFTVLLHSNFLEKTNEAKSTTS